MRQLAVDAPASFPTEITRAFLPSAVRNPWRPASGDVSRRSRKKTFRQLEGFGFGGFISRMSSFGGLTLT
jgi:hypothetical protein